MIIIIKSSFLGAFFVFCFQRNLDIIKTVLIFVIFSQIYVKKIRYTLSSCLIQVILIITVRITLTNTVGTDSLKHIVRL